MPFRSGKKNLILALALLGWGLPLGAAEVKTVERGLVEQAPGLIKQFQKNGYKNVGVLKFLVNREGEKSLSDNVGTLNLLMARRLEVALVLANDVKKPIGIIRNASAVAARTRDANHRNPEGRLKLFEANYPLAWSKDEVKVDAFVTGTAQISKDLRNMTVSLFLFDKGKNKLTQVGDDFTVRNDAGKLTEMSESFVLRGSHDDEEAAKRATGVKNLTVKHPLISALAPVRLAVLSDDKPVKIEYRDGKAFIPEPHEGQRVALRLVRDNAKGRYGVVLKVNGESTVGRQREPDLHCRRWILDQGVGPLTITGYQIDEKTMEKFRVLSREESRTREIYYGDDVGTITMTVFRERTRETIGGNADEEKADRDTRLTGKANLPQQDTFKALKAGLVGAEEEETRGLIGEGARMESKVKVVKFEADPTPVMSITIVYYRP